MPSNYTTNYKLSQWERSDKVQMEDFNADNAKIDAALKVNASSISAEAAARSKAIADLEDRSTMHILAAAVQDSPSTTFAVAMENMDWSQYRMVVVTANITMANNTVYRIATDGQVNTQIGVASTWTQIVLFPMYNADMPICGFIADNSPKVLYAGGRYSGLQGFRFYNVDSQVLPGSTVTIHGIK